MLRSSLFIAAGRIASRLPHFRGRNRAVLSLLPALGLKDRHLHVDAKLGEPTPYLARLDMHSWLQRLAFVDGGYEPQTARLLVQLLQAAPGYLLDVGANVGLISIPAALLARRRVVAIEAIADNVDALRRNIALNDAGDLVDVIPTAIGDIAGKVDIQVEGNLKKGQGTGTANILAAGSNYECERIQIDVTTLDNLVAQGRIAPACGVVKIDTDGYDLKVLQGGRSFIQSCRPVIFGEFSAHCLKWHGQTIEDVRAFAAELGYRVWAAAGHDPITFRASFDNEKFSQDLLLVPSERAAALGWCLV